METTPAYGQPDAVMLSWQVPLECGGMRADRYLALKVGRLSREKIQKLIRKGDFRSAHGPFKPSQRLKGGEHVELWRIPPDSESDAFPEPTIIVEDPNLLVLDKPAGLPIHPSARYLYRTLTHWLRKQGNGVPIAHPCHRLDRETSGIILCAKSKKAESSIKTLFMNGEVSKSYIAIVEGKSPPRFLIDVPLALQGDRGLVHIRMIHDSNGLPSQTAVSSVIYDEELNRSLVVCMPRTGRQHQIRAHLADAGYPIVGDKLYGMGDAYFDAFTKGLEPPEGAKIAHTRHALHAWKLSFYLDGVRSQMAAPLPADFEKLLSRAVYEEATSRLSQWPSFTQANEQ